MNVLILRITKNKSDWSVLDLLLSHDQETDLVERRNVSTTECEIKATVIKNIYKN